MIQYQEQKIFQAQEKLEKDESLKSKFDLFQFRIRKISEGFVSYVTAINPDCQRLNPKRSSIKWHV